MLLTTVRKQPTTRREEIYHLSRRPSNLNQSLCDRAKSVASTQTDGLWPDTDSGLPELSLNQEMKTKGRGTIKCTWTRREGRSGQFQGLWYQPRRDREGMTEERPHFRHRARAVRLDFHFCHGPDSTSQLRLLLHWETLDGSTTRQPGIQFALYINKVKFNTAKFSKTLHFKTQPGLSLWLNKTNMNLLRKQKAFWRSLGVT